MDFIEVEIPVGDDEVIKAGWKREAGGIVKTLHLPPDLKRGSVAGD